MKNYKPLLNILAFLFILPSTSNATIFKAIAGADWHLTTTWDQGNKLPSSTDTVIIDGYNVKFNNNAGDVTISRLEINNSTDNSFLTIEGDNSFTVLNDLEVIAYNYERNVDLKIQNSVNFRVLGSALFERVTGNQEDNRLKLHLLGSATMTVDNNFTFNYNDAADDEGNVEILLETDSKLNILGHTFLNCHGGNELKFELKGSSLLTIIGNIEMNMTGGINFLVGSSSSSSHFQVNGNATLTNSGGTGIFALGAGTSSGSLTVNGNVNLNSTASDRMVMLASSGSSAIVEIKGNISMSALSHETAQIFMDDQSVLKIGGAFLRPTNFGTLNMDNSSTIVFNGSNPQIIPPTKIDNTGNDSLFITNISLQNTSTSPLTLKGDLRVKDILTLNKGNIITHDTAMLYIEDNAVISGGSGTAYIEGPMIKIGRTDNQDFTFPIGSASDYAPLTISKVENSSSEIKAEYFGDPPPWGNNLQASINNINANYYWSFEKNAGNDVKVILHWNEDNAGGISELDDLIVLRLNQTSGSETWENYGNSATTGNTTEGTITSSLLMGDPPPWGNEKFTLGSISALNSLPVELTKFQAASQGSHVYMQWETATESNTSHFEIERSRDVINFETLGSISSVGNTNSTQIYNTRDLNPQNGLNYYRLKIVDNDGSFEYSHIEVVKFESSPSIELFPNPVKDVIQLKIDDGPNSKENTIEIFDRNGKRLFIGNFEFENGRLGINASALNINENGTYFLRISGKTENQILKFIKMSD